MSNDREEKLTTVIHGATNSLLNTLNSSYGPKGLDKMLIRDGKTVVTNDGATIMSFFDQHPIHKILSSVSKSQDVTCGDGTTSVVLLISSIMEYITKLKDSDVHPTKIVDALEIVKDLSLKYIESAKMAILENEFVNVVLTTLSSKIASKSYNMAKIAVEALKNQQKEDIKITKKIGGTLDDIKMEKGYLLPYNGHKFSKRKAKVLLCQFCISPPKTNMDSKVVINDPSLMEKFVREEREYVINIIRKIQKSGADLLIIQKSIMKTAVSELAQHILKKLNILYVDNVERPEMTKLSKILNFLPCADVDLIDEPLEVDIDYCHDMLEICGYGVSIVVSGCDPLVVDEAERSLNDALSVVKTLKEEAFIVPGGGSIEAGISNALDDYTGPHSIVVREISKGFIHLPYYLSSNAGYYSIDLVSQLKRNLRENKNLGISVKSGRISDMINDEGIVQPSKVVRSMVGLSIETCQMLVKIDDILPARK